MAAGGAWGAIAQGVTDIGKTVAAGVASKIAWKRQKRVLKNQIQWRVADMRAAGLNPILAIRPGGGSAGGVNQMQIPPSGQSLATSALNAAQLRLVGKQGDLLEAQTLKTSAETSNIHANPLTLLPKFLMDPEARRRMVKGLKLTVEEAGEASFGPMNRAADKLVERRANSAKAWREMIDRWRNR